jgi:thioredoxin-like negative regulator of GroEL
MFVGRAPAGEPWASTGLEILSATDFSAGRLRRTGTYVVCFGAGWCHPTRQFMPKFVALKGGLPASLAIADITELESPLWDDFQIRITPSIIVFRDGAIVSRLDGRRFVGITQSALAKLQDSLVPR